MKTLYYEARENYRDTLSLLFLATTKFSDFAKEKISDN